LSKLIHPARLMSFDELVLGLETACSAGFVHRRSGSLKGLTLFIYTNHCVYEGTWDIYSIIARGLILDESGRRIVATPFPKFFNLGERQGFIPDLPFEAFEKLDGSLIIIFYHDRAWQCATKGAFDSAQAVWARRRMEGLDLSHLRPGTTYLAEAVYPENRIVVRYQNAELVMLAAYDEQGVELTYDQLLSACEPIGWRVAGRAAFSTLKELVTHTEMLPVSAEGYVVRFSDGLRMKLKGAEYRRIHALISRCTPLAMWEALSAGDDMEAIRRDLPEEFWTDFDDILALLRGEVADLGKELIELAASVAHLSDKELGMSLNTLPPRVRSYLFPYRKLGGITGKVRESLFKQVRPTANVLPGYTPSYAMKRMLSDADG
jgi:RNA ligase